MNSKLTVALQYEVERVASLTIIPQFVELQSRVRLYFIVSHGFWNLTLKEDWLFFKIQQDFGNPKVHELFRTEMGQLRQEKGIW